MKKISALLILFFCACLGAPFAHGAREGIDLEKLRSGSFRVRLVSFPATYKVKFVSSGDADLVLSFSGTASPGCWQIVGACEDFTLEAVESGEDFSILLR